MEPGIFTWKREAKGHAAIWKRTEIIREAGLYPVI